MKVSAWWYRETRARIFSGGSVVRLDEEARVACRLKEGTRHRDLRKTLVVADIVDQSGKHIGSMQVDESIPSEMFSLYRDMYCSTDCGLVV